MPAPAPLAPLSVMSLSVISSVAALVGANKMPLQEPFT
jgi:hypothetical protein